MPQYAAHGFVGLNYKELYSKTFDPADISSFSAESLDFTYDENVDVRDLDMDTVNDMLDSFVNNVASNDGRRLTSKSAKSGSELDLVVSACFCDYTDDAITCDAEFGKERGVASIIGSDPGDFPLTTVDFDFSGLGTLAISVACFDFLGGQGPVSDTVDSSFDCYINNGFGQFYGGNGVSRYTSFFVLGPHQW